MQEIKHHEHSYMYALLQPNLHPRVYWHLNFMLVTSLLLQCCNTKPKQN